MLPHHFLATEAHPRVLIHSCTHTGPNIREAITVRRHLRLEEVGEYVSQGYRCSGQGGRSAASDVFWKGANEYYELRTYLVDAGLLCRVSRRLKRGKKGLRTLDNLLTRSVRGRRVIALSSIWATLNVSSSLVKAFVRGSAVGRSGTYPIARTRRLCNKTDRCSGVDAERGLSKVCVHWKFIRLSISP